MEAVIHVLETDRSDSEIIGYALDALCNVMSNEPTDDGTAHHLLFSESSLNNTLVFYEQFNSPATTTYLQQSQSVLRSST